MVLQDFEKMNTTERRQYAGLIDHNLNQTNEQLNQYIASSDELWSRLKQLTILGYGRLLK
jgi:hypothetical protein